MEKGKKKINGFAKKLRAKQQTKNRNLSDLCRRAKEEHTRTAQSVDEEEVTNETFAERMGDLNEEEQAGYRLSQIITEIDRLERHERSVSNDYYTEQQKIQLSEKIQKLHGDANRLDGLLKHLEEFNRALQEPTQADQQRWMDAGEHTEFTDADADADVGGKGGGDEVDLENMDWCMPGKSVIYNDTGATAKIVQVEAPMSDDSVTYVIIKFDIAETELSTDSSKIRTRIQALPPSTPLPGLPPTMEDPVPNGDRRMSGEELVNEELLVQALLALEFSLEWIEHYQRKHGNNAFFGAGVFQYMKELKTHCGGNLSNLKFFNKTFRKENVDNWNKNPKRYERNLPDATGKYDADPKTNAGQILILCGIFERKYGMNDAIKSGALVSGLDGANSRAGGNYTADGATLMTIKHVEKRMLEIGTYHDDQKIRRRAMVFVAMLGRLARRLGFFHVGMQMTEGLARVVEKNGMKSFLHVTKRGDTFGAQNVSKSYQKHAWFFKRIYLSRMISHFVTLMEQGKFPSPASLFPDRVMDVDIFQKHVIGPLVNNEEHQSAMFHFWGTQTYQLFGGVLALRACIRDGDAEKLDCFVLFFFPMVLNLGKTNYQKLFADHIILMTYDNIIRRRKYFETMCVNVESPHGRHKIAKDEVLEVSMDILKPVLRVNGESLVDVLSKHIFLAKTIQRLVETSAGGRTSAVRHHVDAKQLDDMTAMVGLFMRSGVCDPAIQTIEWSFENQTLHLVAHHQSDIGEARQKEGWTLEMNGTEAAASVGLISAGTHRIIRAQVTPVENDNKTTVSFQVERVAVDVALQEEEGE